MTSSGGFSQPLEFAELPLEIFDKISSFLSMADFLALRKVCKRLYQFENLPRRFNINMLLRPFVSEPDMFRFQLGTHNALISGCFALDFFGSASSNVPALDLFVETGNQRDKLVDYIKGCEDYDRVENPQIQMAMRQTVLSRSKTPGKVIRITSTDDPPIETILRRSYATTNVNFISWNKAYSVFPLPTVIHHKFYSLKPMDYKFGSILQEQSNQGWTTRDMIWADLMPNARCQILSDSRRVGDRSSFIIPLDCTGVQKPSTPNYALEYAQFEVFMEPVETVRPVSAFPSYQVQTAPRGYPQIEFKKLESPALRYKYLYIASSWYKFLMDRLQRWLQIELAKLKPQDRHAHFAAVVPPHSGISLPFDFHHPDSWDYADDQIPKWYSEWEQLPKEDRRDRDIW